MEAIRRTGADQRITIALRSAGRIFELASRLLHRTGAHCEEYVMALAVRRMEDDPLADGWGAATPVCGSASVSVWGTVDGRSPSNSPLAPP